MRKLKVLITGGAGFIGSHLADALLSLGNEVIVYDNFDEYYPNKEMNIQNNLRNPNFRLIKADILDFETLLRCMKEIDVVFHLAAQPSVGFSMQNPVKTTIVNVLGTLNALTAAKEADVKRVIFASSSSTYGSPKYMPIDENHPANPISIYGVSKLAAEKYCEIFNDQFDIPIVILRYFTVYGPRQRPDMAIHKWTKAIFEGKPVVIYGDGEQTRDFTYIDDAVDGTLRVAEVEGIERGIFNLGAGTRMRIKEVVKGLIDISGTDAQVVYEPPRSAEVHDTYADIRKAKKILDFCPKTLIKDGLRCFVQWYAFTKLPRINKKASKSLRQS